MSAPDPSGDFRHALINLLAPLLTEAQLALAAPTPLDPETRRSLVEIETLALKMRAVLRESRATDSTHAGER